MAKLEDQISPNELVQIIRTGKTKSEIIKEYRTSDQELAMMLLPLYRAGQLTKDEFNDFFKGLPLKSAAPEPEEVVPEAAPAPEEVAEAPADTRARLARVFSRKAKAKEEEEPAEEVAAEELPPPVEEVPEEPTEEPTEEAVEELADEDIFVEEEPPAETVEAVAEPVDEELEFEEIEAEEVVETEIEPEPEPAEIVAEPEKAAVVRPEPIQEAGGPAIDEALGKILARLESIEKRLIRIEKNLPTR